MYLKDFHRFIIYLSHQFIYHNSHILHHHNYLMMHLFKNKSRKLKFFPLICSLLSFIILNRSSFLNIGWLIIEKHQDCRITIDLRHLNPDFNIISGILGSLTAHISSLTFFKDSIMLEHNFHSLNQFPQQ